MNILLCPDGFKGSMTALQFCTYAADAIHKIKTGHTVHFQAMADGGEGSLEAIYPLLSDPHIQSTETVDPLYRKIKVSYVLDHETAYIEMAAASGYALVREDERNVLKANTYGTGLLIKDALDKGAKTICLFAGGSATVDGGTGLLQALGYQLYDANKRLIPCNTNALPLVAYVDASKAMPIPALVIAADVTNPLTGEMGAARVFGPQKGATVAQIHMLDEALLRWQKICEMTGDRKLADFKGMGAAGGVAAVLPLTDGTITQGADLIISKTGLKSKIEWADLVITGEGCFDAQSMMGKITGHVITLAEQAQKPCIVICGKHTDNVKTTAGIYPFTRYCDATESMKQPALCIERAIQDLFK